MRLEPRFTKWGRAATTFILVAVSVAVVLSYYQRTHLFRQTEKQATRILPDNVTMHTRGFYYSQSENGQTTFDVTADVNLGYKDNKNFLEQVNVRVLGRTGNRYDTITSQRCEFDQAQQDIVFMGKVVISLGSLSGTEDLKLRPPTEETSTVLRLERIRFSQANGQAETDDLVNFARGLLHGTARGLTYNTRTGAVLLRSEVDITLDPAKPGDAPIHLRSGSLRYSKEMNQVEILSSVSATRAQEEIQADRVTVFLDKESTAVRLIEAEGSVQSISRDPRYMLRMDARRVSYFFSSDGHWIDRIAAREDVRSWSLDPSSKRDIMAQNLDIIFRPKTNVAQSMKASGNVRCVFSDRRRTPPVPVRAIPDGFETGDKVLDSPVVTVLLASNGRQPSRIEARGPSTLREFPLMPREERKSLFANAIDFFFVPDTSVLERLNASNQVRVELVPENGPVRKTFSDRLVANLDRQTRQIRDLIQSGSFRFIEGDREATAEGAHYLADSKTTILESHAQVHNTQGRTAADVIEFHQDEDLVKARGSVRSVLYSSDSRAQPGGFKTSAPVFATADFMESHTQSGVARYWKRAKLWQDDQVIRAETISLYRDEKKMVAEKDVNTIFYLKPQQQRGENQSDPSPFTGQADKLTYEDKLERMLYESHVNVVSSMGQLTADRLEVFLNKESNQTSLERMLAQGNVRVQQEGRTSYSSSAEYFASDELVVLTGGPPRIIDPVRGFTSGARLTMHLNDDRIAVEGDSEQRTITRQNVAR
jgi:LPS export ABC transporter protein LptC